MSDHSRCVSESSPRSTNGPSFGALDVPQPEIDRPFNSIDPTVTDIKKYGLKETKISDPYLVNTNPPPQHETDRFNLYRFPLYLLGMVYGVWHALIALIKVLIGKQLPYQFLDDDDFCQLIDTHWPLPFLLKEEKDGKTLTLDTRILEKVKPFKGYYTQGTFCRFHRDENNKLTIDSIEIAGTVVLPSEQDEWKLAKMFVLHGAKYILMFALHPHLHFPQESFISITRYSFHREHPIRQLLEPHMEFMRPINVNVLVSDGSVLNSGDGVVWMWDAQMTDRSEIQGLLRYGGRNEVYTGHSPNKRLQPFYKLIYDFCRKVCKHVKLDDSVREWGDSLHHYLGYPFKGADIVADGTKAASILADYIFRVTVWHSADHYGYEDIPTELDPMRIKIPFTPGIKINPSMEIVSLRDYFAYIVYSNMFVYWWNNRLFYDTRLVSTEYSFELPALQKAASEFIAGLRKLGNIPGEIPLDRIAKCIEW